MKKACIDCEYCKVLTTGKKGIFWQIYSFLFDWDITEDKHYCHHPDLKNCNVLTGVETQSSESIYVERSPLGNCGPEAKNFKHRLNYV